MAPLVLHGVPDEELYTGKDGITRPFAVVGAADERRSTRLRRQAVANQGSFGRARTRQRSGSAGPGTRRPPQPAKSVAATTAADEVFGNWKREQELFSQQQHHGQQEEAGDHQKGGGGGGGSSGGSDYLYLDPPSSSGLGVRKSSSGSLGGGAAAADEATAATAVSKKTQAAHTSTLPLQNQPTEVILRGYRSPDYQYAALRHYEQLAGRICEDYPRDPPVGSRRYRSGLRDTAAIAAATVASNGRAALTTAERQAVMQRAASGRHWVKVTFESASAADAALYASPQRVLGYLVYAEPYRGVPLADADDVAVPDPDSLVEYEEALHHRHGLGQGRGGAGGRSRGGLSVSPVSSHTVESGTVNNDDIIDGFARALSSTTSSATLSGAGAGGTGSGRTGGGGGGVDNAGYASDKTTFSGADNSADSQFCQRIPTARRATLRAPEQALLPRESATRQFVKRLPLLHRLTGTIIGNQVPRKENGLFDWESASLYWKLIWWLDFLFSLFGGEILDANKDD